MCNSRNCFVVASEGAPIIRSTACWFIGKSEIDRWPWVRSVGRNRDPAVPSTRLGNWCSVFAELPAEHADVPQISTAATLPPAGEQSTAFASRAHLRRAGVLTLVEDRHETS